MIESGGFAEEYERMAEHELLTLGRVYDTLTEPAQTALRKEFSRRGLEAPLVEDEAEGTELITIRRYRDLSEGIVARSLLESAGIHVELRDENLIRLDWQLSNFVGGLRLQVYAPDVEVANELLDRSVVDPVPFGADMEFEQPRCPHCGSTEITFEGASRAAALTSLYLLAVPMPPGRETWRCSACDTRWIDEG